MSKKTQQNEQKTAEIEAKSLEITPVRRQFETPHCPRCMSKDTSRYAQKPDGNGGCVKYCRCGRCNWTWTVFFRPPVLG